MMLNCRDQAPIYKGEVLWLDRLFKIKNRDKLAKTRIIAM